MRIYTIAYLNDRDEEDFIQVRSYSEDAAIKYCGIPLEKVLYVECAMCDAKRAYG